MVLQDVISELARFRLAGWGGADVRFELADPPSSAFFPRLVILGGVPVCEYRVSSEPSFCHHVVGVGPLLGWSTVVDSTKVATVEAFLSVIEKAALERAH